MHRSSSSTALAAMAGAKPSFKGSLEKHQQAYLASNVCADDGSAALDGCKRAARHQVEQALVRENDPLSYWHPTPSSTMSFPSLTMPIRCLAERAMVIDWEGRLVVRGAATPLATAPHREDRECHELTAPAQEAVARYHPALSSCFRRSRGPKVNKVKVSGFGDANRTRCEVVGSGIRRLAVACARRVGQPHRQAASRRSMCCSGRCGSDVFPPTPSPDCRHKLGPGCKVGMSCTRICRLDAFDGGARLWMSRDAEENDSSSCRCSQRDSICMAAGVTALPFPRQAYRHACKQAGSRSCWAVRFC